MSGDGQDSGVGQPPPAGLRLLAAGLAIAVSGCFDFQRALDGCRDDGGAWVCPRAGDGGGDGGGGSGGGAGGGSGGSGGGGGSGGSGGGTGGGTPAPGSIGSDGGCPGLFRAGWCWENPHPAGIDLYEVAGTSDSDVYFVGPALTFLRFDGQSWFEVRTLIPSGNLTALALRPDGRGWLGGAGIGGLWSNASGPWAQVNPQAERVAQLVALADGGVLAAAETGVFGAGGTALLSVPNEECTGVVEAPWVAGGFLAACHEMNGATTTRKVRRGDGTVELSEPGPSSGSFRFTRMWKDGLGRVFVAGSGTPTPAPCGSVHLRSDAGSWSTLFVWDAGGASGCGTDAYSGSGLDTSGSFAVVGQNGSVARFFGLQAGPAYQGALPETFGGILRAQWLSPSGTLWVAGQDGYAGSGEGTTLPVGWSVHRRGPGHAFLGLEVTDAGVLAVGDSAETWLFPGRAPGPSLGVRRYWRAVWRSPTGRDHFVNESGEILTQPSGGPAGTSGTSFHDVWGTSNDDVLFPAYGSLKHWDGVALTDVASAPAVDFWKVHGSAASGEAFAVGEVGMIWRRPSFDAGWTQLPAPPLPDGGTYAGTLFSVRWLSPGQVVVGGDEGWVFETRPDGGFAPIQILNGTSIYDLHPASDGGYYAVGGSGAVWRRRGATWVSYSVETESPLERARLFGGRLWVVGQQGQVLSRPEP